MSKTNILEFHNSSYAYKLVFSGGRNLIPESIEFKASTHEEREEIIRKNIREIGVAKFYQWCSLYKEGVLDSKFELFEREAGSN